MLQSRGAAIFSLRPSTGERARFERYVVDEAWKLEEEFWAAGMSGQVHQYFARVLAADAFAVVPGHVLVREDLLRQWQERAALEQFSFSEQRIVLVNGETVVLTYRVNAQQS